MFDKFMFSNGQNLASVSTVVSTKVWDLEEGVAVDQQVFGWINVKILTAVNPGCTEGLWVEFRSDDDEALSFTLDGTETADESVLAAIWLREADLVAGRGFSFGVNSYALGRYVGIWYRAHSSPTSGGTLTADVWFSEQPHEELGVQKKNISTGA